MAFKIDTRKYRAIFDLEIHETEDDEYRCEIACLLESSNQIKIFDLKDLKSNHDKVKTISF
jgi:hypothetical protein